MMQSNSEYDQLTNQLSQLPFIKAIYLYGSRARETNDPRSDIDLAFDCEDITDAQWNEVIDLIEQYDTLYHIDYVRLDRIQNSRLMNNIIKDGKVLFERGENSE